MGDFVVSAQATPNPNAVKFVTNRRLTEGAPKTYRSVEAAKDDVVAARVLALPAVTGVTLLRDFCSVTQDGSADWGVLKPQIEAILRDVLDG